MELGVCILRRCDGGLEGGGGGGGRALGVWDGEGLGLFVVWGRWGKGGEAGVVRWVFG